MTLDERIGLYLAKCPPAVSGQDGHGTTFRVACSLVNGFALDSEAAFRHLVAYNETCCPPWKPRELRHKLEQARKVSHEKPRGHLLGEVNGYTRSPAGRVPRVAPVRLKPEKVQKSDLRTVRTVFSNPCGYASEKNHHVTHTHGCSKQPSVPSVEPDGLIPVPGCHLARPVEIEMADAEWRAVVASELGEEPLVQYALQMFGPGCTVVETGRAAR